jgi:hypothetical protein
LIACCRLQSLQPRSTTFYQQWVGADERETRFIPNKEPHVLAGPCLRYSLNATPRSIR